jgi:RHS repeat-associated protein
MKKRILTILISLLVFSLFSQNISVSESINDAYCTGFEKGSVILNPSGGIAPYSFSWDDLISPLTSNIRTQMKPGKYHYSIIDANNLSVSGSVELLSCMRWQESTGVEVGDNLITKESVTGWGNAGTNSLNKLTAEDEGYIVYSVESPVTNFSFGFDIVESSITQTYEEIKYAFLISDGRLFVTMNGKIQAELGGFDVGTELKIFKTADLMQFFKDEELLFEISYNDNSDMRVEIALYGQNDAIRGIKGTFFRKELAADVFSDALIEGLNNSGFISIAPKNGLEPYTYRWSNLGVGNTIDNLCEGDYRGVVYDDAGDSLVVKKGIGNKVGWGERKNIQIADEGLNKIDLNLLAVVGLDKYISKDGVGWFEFVLTDKMKEFNIAMREFTAIENVTQDISSTVYKTESVILTGESVPHLNSPEYNSLNILDNSNYPSSLTVLKYEFTASETSEVILSDEHGIVCKDGYLYFLYNGYTIKKGVSLTDGDVIRIQKTNASINFLLNGILVSTASYTEEKDLAVDINIGIGGLLLQSPMTSGFGPMPKGGGGGNCTEPSRNWVYSKTYDGLGNVVSESKGYMNVFGQTTQVLHKDETKNNVIATQTIYDAFGRTILQTLPAPTFQSSLCYFDDFIKNQSGTLYTYNDFDVPNWTSNFSSLTAGERDSPKPVANTVKGSLGWYYSNNNSDEPFVPTASQPYHRIEYDLTNPSDILRSSVAGLGLNHGSGHETCQIAMRAAGELYYFLGFMNSWKITDMASHFDNYSACRSMRDVKTDVASSLGNNVIKTISRDENGVETVTFTDAMGNLVGECLAGSVGGANQQVQGVYDMIDVSPGSLYPFVDVHLADGCQSSIVLEQPAFPYSGTITYDIINLKTGRCDQCGYTGTNPTLGPGFYRIKPVGIPSSYQSHIKIQYQTNYYNFKAYYYDKANRLRIVVPPKGLDYSGSALGQYTFNNGSISKKFASTGVNSVNGGSMPNTTIGPANWELGAGSGNHNMSLNITVGGAYYTIDNFVVKFTGKSTGWTMHFPEENNPTETYRTSSGENAPSGDIAKMIYPIDETDDVYSTSEFIGNPILFDKLASTNPLNAVAPPYPNLPVGFNAMSAGGTVCSTTVMPVVIKYQIVDQTNNDAPVSGVMSVTGYCTIKECTGTNTSYLRTWTFPPQNTHQMLGLSNGNNWVAKLKILDIFAIQNLISNPNGVPWEYFTDITTTFSSKSGRKPDAPGHTMTEVYEYDNWGQLIISKKPDSGQTDYVYGPDGKIRASQNSRQDIGGASSTDEFSYLNYDSNQRPVEEGVYNRGISSASSNVKFKNYKEFVSDNTPPSVIIEANNNNNIVDAGRKQEVVYTYYDFPDPNFIIQTGLNPAVFAQNYLIGKVSWSMSDEKMTWYSYDELGRVKWMVNRYNNVDEAVSPFTGVIIKTFWYTYDYLGNPTQVDYQYHLSTSIVSDKTKTEYQYDSDKRLIKVKSTVYGDANPETKTVAEYSYYLHGPLKRKQLADNLQGIDYVYTVNGALKSINSPELDVQHDPGIDGYYGVGRVSYEDIFGMGLDYFNGDYERNSLVQTYADPSPQVAANYDGNVTVQRWKTKVPSGISLAYQNKQLAYFYKYDKKGQLLEATFGEVTNNHVYSSLGGMCTSPSFSYKTDYKLLLSYDYNGNILNLTRNAYAAGADGLFMDDMTYNYTSCTNKLSYVADAIYNAPPNNPNPYSTFGFASGQTNSNYSYDVLGELTADVGGNKNYEYTGYGQISLVRDKLTNNPLAEYKYDEDGLRICKITYDPANPSNVTKTLYVRDNGGKIASIYTKPVTSNLFAISESNVYGGEERNATVYYDNGVLNTVYEINDHLGSTRTTFKEGKKKVFSTSLAQNSPDNCFLKDPNSTISTAIGVVASCPSSNQNKIIGITSVDIPANPGDIMTATVKAKYINNGSNPVVQGKLIINVVDASGNLISGLTANANVSSAASNAFENLSINLTNPSNASTNQKRYFRVFVQNTAATPVGFEDLAMTLNGTGGYRMPEQLDIVNYYPHGSEMPGLTYHTTLGGRNGYQGQFTENDKEINEIVFDLRHYDPLIGRFMTLDPEEQFDSPYLAMGNNHPNIIDPTGGAGEASWGGAILGAAAGAAAVAAIDYYVQKDHKFDIPLGYYLLGAWVGSNILAPVFGAGENGWKLEEAVICGGRLRHAHYTGRGINGWFFEPVGGNGALNINLLGVSITSGKNVMVSTWTTVMDASIRGPQRQPLVVNLMPNDRFMNHALGNEAGIGAVWVVRTSIGFHNLLPRRWFYVNPRFIGTLVYPARQPTTYHHVIVQTRTIQAKWKSLRGIKIRIKR